VAAARERRRLPPSAGTRPQRQQSTGTRAASGGVDVSLSSARPQYADCRRAARAIHRLRKWENLQRKPSTPTAMRPRDRVAGQNGAYERRRLGTIRIYGSCIGNFGGSSSSHGMRILSSISADRIKHKPKPPNVSPIKHVFCVEDQHGSTGPNVAKFNELKVAPLVNVNREISELYFRCS
jgi:hypothetical protein